MNSYPGARYGYQNPRQTSYSERELKEQHGEQVEKYNKHEEFKQFTDQVKERTRLDPKRTVEDEVKEVLQWTKNLENRPMRYGPRPKRPMMSMRNKPTARPAAMDPNPGMNPYWAEPEPKKTRFPTPGPNTPRMVTGQQAMDAALRTLKVGYIKK
ncbi:seminal fluid protein HACP043 [Danaus plexippus plexippus]|uniref:Seminal fluid protein HACP043 n=1 Tax=Danaus plexippus plexippus TaxID=278856 RepID=A0A212EV94_DANPL|nr:seminal fluid protein HACP043 [Danaus plexippus plexippus]